MKHYSDKSFLEPNKKKKQRRFLVFLVGAATFGKGSVQEVIPVSNGCALKLTTMLYYLPNKESIQAVGIEPDFMIKPKIVPTDEIKWIKEMYGKESSLKHHITVKEVEKNNNDGSEIKEPSAVAKAMSDGMADKQEKEEKEKSWEEKQQEAINHDVQIQASINMISLLDFAKKHTPKEVNSRQKALTFLQQNFMTDEKIELEKVK